MKAKQAQNKRFPYHIFFIYFGILLLMSGIHTGFITPVSYTHLTLPTTERV